MNTYRQTLTEGMRLWKSLGYTITLTGGPKGNVGILKGWPDTNLTEDELAHQIATNHRCTGIAIVTNGLCVFDLDGTEGLTNWATLTHQHPVKEPNLIQFTPSGGQHWLYQTTPDTRWSTSANMLAPKVDVRAERGLIAVWPTVRTDGTRYELNDQPCHINELPQAPKPWTTNNLNTPGNAQPLPENVTDIRTHWTQDGTNYLCKAHQDNHGSLSIRFMQDGAWALKCFSGCTTQAILTSVGLTHNDLHPTTTVTNLDTKIENTFGPNPCTSLVLTNEDGTAFGSPCNLKRCVHCGPRKKARIQHQLQTIGTTMWISHTTDLTELDRELAAVRKACQRASTRFTYQIVGDSTLGYIIASDIQIIPTQRSMRLTDWMDRILDLYHHSVQRIRRTYNLGTVSIVRLRRKTISGQPSPWYRRSTTSDVIAEVKDLNWTDELAEIEWREGVLYTHPPTPTPDTSLPDPF